VKGGELGKCRRSVALITPMKRGLKEEIKYQVSWLAAVVALITPMKRGLKVNSNIPNHKFLLGCTNYPDEKGTESRHTAGP